jgi:CO/xanthine dehydrogenase Mo-binding subunit
MPTLTIGTRTYTVSHERVIRAAERLRKLSEARRAHSVDKAKTQLARAAASSDSSSGNAAKQAAAVLLSQGVSEI